MRAHSDISSTCEQFQKEKDQTTHIRFFGGYLATPNFLPSFRAFKIPVSSFGSCPFSVWIKIFVWKTAGTLHLIDINDDTINESWNNIIKDMRRCQIRVQFESGARTKFLAALFQPMTSMSDYQSVPWSHSFQNMYNTHMFKMHLIVEKWGFSKKIYLNFIKNCKVLLECYTLGHCINTFMNTNHKLSYMNGFVLA